MNDILVSVIIPTYQRPQYLNRAILSVANQSYKNIEIVVVDDNGKGTGCQIETQNVIKSLPFEINYIVNEDTIGGARSRNKGAEASSGEYLCFLDDDDIYLENKIKDQLEFMVGNDLDVSFTDIKMRNEEEKTVDKRIHKRYIKSTDNQSLLKYHLKYHLTPTDSYMFKREAFFRCGGFKHRVVSQDFMLMLECIEKGLKIGYKEGVYAIQYIHSQKRISQGKNRILGDRMLYEIKQKYFNLLDKRDIRFIKFRYHAALFFYYIRKRDFIKGAKELVLAFFKSPCDFFVEGFYLLSGRD